MSCGKDFSFRFRRIINTLTVMNTLTEYICHTDGFHFSPYAPFFLLCFFVFALYLLCTNILGCWVYLVLGLSKVDFISFEFILVEFIQIAKIVQPLKRPPSGSSHTVPAGKQASLPGTSPCHGRWKPVARKQHSAFGRILPVAA